MMSQPRTFFPVLFAALLAATACDQSPTGTDLDDVAGAWTLASLDFGGASGLPFYSGFGLGTIAWTVQQGDLQLRSDQTYVLALEVQGPFVGTTELEAVDEGSFTVSGKTITFHSVGGDAPYRVGLVEGFLDGDEVAADGTVFGAEGVVFDFAPPAPRVYDLRLDLESIWVRNNCEDGDGNEGEWVWQVEVDVPGSPLWERNSGGHSPTSAVSWADQTLYPVSGSLEIQGVSESSRANATITLRATEWDFDVDPPAADPDMDDRSQTESLAEARGVEGDAVDLGGGRCSILLGYEATWTAR